MYDNQLSGSIPPELGNLGSLQGLYLHSNQLSGSIPPELGNLANLRNLHLGSNELIGSIPPELGNLANLENLRLHSNPLSGALPLSLMNLSELYSFWFHMTDLCEPPDADFQAWLASIPNLMRTGVLCGVMADFSGAPTSGLAPLTVVFTNTSTGDYDTSLWLFGDGITSTLEHPTHEYQLPGAYTVTLTVDGPGGTDTLTRTDYITVYEPVEADFSGTPTSGLAPLTVVFTNTSTGDYDTSLWLFGDGSTSTLPNPVHIYPAAGAYTVTLTVSGAGGSDTKVRAGYITVHYGVYLPVLLRGS